MLDRPQGVWWVTLAACALGDYLGGAYRVMPDVRNGGHCENDEANSQAGGALSSKLAAHPDQSVRINR